MFPFHSPLSTDFHHYKEHTITISNNMTERGRIITSELKTEVRDNPDIKLVPELELLELLELSDNSNYNGYSFVATLHQPILLLLVRDETGMIEFNDIQHYTCKVKIGIPHKDSTERRIISDILNYYPDSVKNNTDIIPLNKWTTNHSTVGPTSGLILGHDYHIHAQLVYPGKTNSIIRKLTEEQPSHLMTMVRINGGNYFITGKEKAFYKKNTYYEKALYDLQRSIKFYPQLSRIGSQQYSLYLPTIKCRYLLLAKDSVDNRTINKIIRKLFILYTSRKIKEMTLTDMVRNVTKLPIHPASKKIYGHLHLVKDADTRSSIYENNIINRI